MAVCKSRHILLGGDTPQTPLKVQTPGDPDSDYLKSPNLKLQKEQAFFNQPLIKSNRCITEISLRSNKPIKPASTCKQTKNKPAVLFHSRRTQQEAEVCPFISLIQNLPAVEQEVIVIEDKHTHAGTKTASKQHAKVVDIDIRKSSQKSSALNCLKKDTFDHHLRHECAAYDTMAKMDTLNDLERSKGCKAVQVSMRNQYTLSPTDREWVRDLNSESRTLEYTTQSRQYHECTVIDNRDTDTIVSDQDNYSKLFPQSPAKHCRPCKRSCDASESVESQPPTINYVPPREEFFKTSCTVDLANPDANCTCEETQSGPSCESCVSNEAQIGLSEAFMRALLRVHEKPFLNGLLGRIEQIRFRWIKTTYFVTSWTSVYHTNYSYALFFEVVLLGQL